MRPANVFLIMELSNSRQKADETSGASMIKFEKTRILFFFNLGIDFFLLIPYNSYC